MQIAPFATEQFYALYEFNTPHLLSVSDCETVTVERLLALAGASLADLGRLGLGYTESQGDPELRSLIAADYDSVAAESVVVLTSPIEGIYLTMRTLLEPGDEAIILTPAYDALKNVAAHICGSVVEWPLQATATGWQLDLIALEALVTPQTKLLVVNFPHNPTGFLPTLDDAEAIIALAARHNLWLFSDEMYRGLELGDRQPLPSLAERYERSIVLSGLSKAYGLPGLRAGWLLVPDTTIRQQLINWKYYTTICPAAPTEFLAKAALQAKESLLARSQETIAANLALADAFFARWPQHFIWRRPQAGSVALVGLGVGLKVASATRYCHQLAQMAGVLLLPGTCLGYDDAHVRFGFGRQSFAEALAHYETQLTL